MYNNLGIGGITKSLVDVLHIINYSKYDVTLYVRRDDILDCIDEIPSQVDTRIVENEVKKKVFEKNLWGCIVKVVYNQLNKHHRYLAKQFFLKYKYPLQRKKEKQRMEGVNWDVAISYSTDGDDPVFVDECVNAKRKYIFVHQSTEIAKMNIKAMKRYDGVISVNPLLEPWIKDMVGASKKIHTIENYVDFEKVRRKANEKVDLLERKYIFSTCGRLCKTKGFDYVVQTAKILKDNAVDFVWYWIGDGPDRKEMERIINENGLENEVVITGMQSNPYPYIKACDIYVQPSRAEAYPLSILEALILEKIVITTRTKGGEYILEKHGCGILVDESPVQIASKIMNLLQNKKKLEEQNRKVQAIDWEEEKTRYTREWEELLEGSIGTKG